MGQNTIRIIFTSPCLSCLCQILHFQILFLKSRNTVDFQWPSRHILSSLTPKIVSKLNTDTNDLGQQCSSAYQRDFYFRREKKSKAFYEKYHSKTQEGISGRHSITNICYFLGGCLSHNFKTQNCQTQ